MNDSERLTKAVDRFCQFIATLPVDVLVEQHWGPKEVLAHLVYHHELYANLAEAFLAGTPMEPPKGTFRELNAQAVAASRGIPPSELVNRFQKANQRLVELYQQHDPREITVEIKAGAKLRTLAELVPEVEAHIRNHLKKLCKDSRPKRAAQQAPPPDSFATGEAQAVTTAIVTTKGTKDETQNQVTLYSIGLVAGHGNRRAGSIKWCANKSCEVVFHFSSCAAAITDGIARTSIVAIGNACAPPSTDGDTYTCCHRHTNNSSPTWLPHR